MNPRTILTIVLIAWAVLAAISMSGIELPKPQNWLKEWTAWIAAVAGIVVTARVLWAGGTRLLRRAQG